MTTTQLHRQRRPLRRSLTLVLAIPSLATAQEAAPPAPPFAAAVAPAAPENPFGCSCRASLLRRAPVTPLNAWRVGKMNQPVATNRRCTARCASRTVATSSSERSGYGL
jgi:hypothetical protein